MLIISYDIKNDKLRTRFSKFIKKYGHRLQYSVFEIDNSKRILDNIKREITNTFEQHFEQTDSVMIIETSENCKITKWGYAKNDDSSIIIVN
ncbi:MAG: CRISPR-associated endonuclease Cas2 [Alphaproteobacteria bacterium]|nr:CRISPR-associated endonuclease Cas2 [Alphaproteobacteria bacterium]